MRDRGETIAGKVIPLSAMVWGTEEGSHRREGRTPSVVLIKIKIEKRLKTRF